MISGVFKICVEWIGFGNPCGEGCQTVLQPWDPGSGVPAALSS